MATNERVAYNSGEIAHEQLAPSKSQRTMFTPGKISSKAGDENWPKEHRIPKGCPQFMGELNGPAVMDRMRVVKLGRNIISDQTVLTPVVSDIRIETRTEEGVSGANTTTDTVNPTNLTERERQAGNDNFGATP